MKIHVAVIPAILKLALADGHEKQGNVLLKGGVGLPPPPKVLNSVTYPTQK